VPGADQVQAVTLANGLQVIVWPDHDIPNIALFNWVHAGSRNEVPGITGLAHFFEHMMFNGTKTRPQGEFDRVLEANGARNNAFTTNDVDRVSGLAAACGAAGGIRGRSGSPA
jgi:zinc protease